MLDKYDQGSSNPLWLPVCVLGFAHEDAQTDCWLMSSRYGREKLSLRFRSYKFWSWFCCVTLGKLLPSLSLFPHHTTKGLCPKRTEQSLPTGLAQENFLEEMGLCRV